MVERLLVGKVRELRGKFPVLSLTGPRQSGKTTLLREVYADLPYVSLEDPDNRRDAERDPRGFLARFPNGAVIDEAQHVPDIFSYIQGIVDASDVHFALSGSQNFLLLERISQSLAGRVAILRLLPFSLSETGETGHSFADWEDAAFTGGFPRIFHRGIAPVDFYPAYVSTYIEKDVRSMRNIGSLSTFHTFLKLCAGRVGQLLNMQSLATDAGVSPNTAKDWLSVLEASYVIHYLHPHHRNFNKRLVKSPKLYFCDTGLVCSLLGLEDAGQLRTHYLKGGIFENLIVNEQLKARWHRGRPANAYFWQNRTRQEIDMLIESGGRTHPVELKSGKTRSPSFFDNLQYWQELSGIPSEMLHVVYGGEEDVTTAEGNFIGWRNAQRLFGAMG